MKKIILTVILTLVILMCGFMSYIYSGCYDIAQTTPHNNFTKWIINTTTHNSISSRLKNIQIPNLEDTVLIAEGFKHYNEMCTGCHGAPGVEQDEISKGLYPQPPKIYKNADEVPNPDEAFWIIKNGIKMTSMPALSPTHNDQKIWAITAFVTKKLARMSPEEYHSWVKKYTNQNKE